MRPLTLSLSPSGGEGIETAPSPSSIKRVGVRVETARDVGVNYAGRIPATRVRTPGTNSWAATLRKPARSK